MGQVTLPGASATRDALASRLAGRVPTAAAKTGYLPDGRFGEVVFVLAGEALLIAVAELGEEPAIEERPASDLVGWRMESTPLEHHVVLQLCGEPDRRLKLSGFDVAGVTNLLAQAQSTGASRSPAPASEDSAQQPGTQPSPAPSVEKPGLWPDSAAKVPHPVLLPEAAVQVPEPVAVPDSAAPASNPAGQPLSCAAVAKEEVEAAPSNSREERRASAPSGASADLTDLLVEADSAGALRCTRCGRRFKSPRDAIVSDDGRICQRCQILEEVRADEHRVRHGEVSELNLRTPGSEAYWELLARHSGVPDEDMDELAQKHEPWFVRLIRWLTSSED